MGPLSGNSWGAGQQDSYHIVKLLVEAGHRVNLVSYDCGTNPGQIERFKQTGADVSVFPIDLKFSIFREKNLIKNLILWLDPATHPFYKLRASDKFIKFFEEFSPDVVYGIQTFTFPVLDFSKKRGKVTIMRSHNVEYRHHMDMFRGMQLLNPKNILLYLFKYAVEVVASKETSFVFAISPKELNFYKKWNTNSKLLTLCALYEKIKDSKERFKVTRERINIFYAGGTYNILPHLKGAEILIEKVAPQLQAQEPDIFVLHLFGSKLPQRLIDKCDGKKIIYHGYVDDYDVAVEEMDIGAFPTFTGRGMKQKIFEAICKSFPVVVPRKALGGYMLEHNKSVLIADNVDAFTENILNLKDGKLREEISRGAYEFAKENFSKEKYLNILCEKTN